MISKDPIRIAALVDAINRERSTSYVLVGKMERGVNGAWLVKTGDDVQHVLKLVSVADVTEQIALSAKCAEMVNGPDSRCPHYEQIGFAAGLGSWYVQEFLPGEPAPWPSVELVCELIKFNERQTGRSIGKGMNWSKLVRAVLFDDAKGWQSNICAYSRDGQTLVECVQSVIARHMDFSPSESDIVHGDFQHYNALALAGDRLAGYVDWDGAGFGDRAFDLARLLYDVYVAEKELGYTVSPESVDMLKAAIEQHSGRAGLAVYMCYWILQVADFGTHMGREAFEKFFQTGIRILEDLL